MEVYQEYVVYIQFVSQPSQKSKFLKALQTEKHRLNNPKLKQTHQRWCTRQWKRVNSQLTHSYMRAELCGNDPTHTVHVDMRHSATAGKEWCLPEASWGRGSRRWRASGTARRGWAAGRWKCCIWRSWWHCSDTEERQECSKCRWQLQREVISYDTHMT